MSGTFTKDRKVLRPLPELECPNCGQHSIFSVKILSFGENGPAWIDVHVSRAFYECSECETTFRKAEIVDEPSQ